MTVAAPHFTHLLYTLLDNAANKAHAFFTDEIPVAATDAGRRSKDAPVALDRTTTMTEDQARKTDPSAKYYSTESFNANQTPVQMNCETPTGERRMFYLSDGKLTSI